MVKGVLVGVEVDHKKFLERCYELARNSPCLKMRFGSVIVKDGLIVGEGFNSSPNPACNDCGVQCAGGIRLGVPSGTRLELCHATHAEQWALLRAGTKASGGTVYVAGTNAKGEPAFKDDALPIGHPQKGFYCTFCIRLIWAAGCKEIICARADGSPFVQSLESAWETSYGTALAVK